MFWKNLVNLLDRTQIRLVLIVTGVATVASAVVLTLLLLVVLKGFSDQDRMELDSRLLSYWAAWQYGGNTAILERASIDMKEHGSRPFLVVLDDFDGTMLGGIIPGGWERFNFSHPDLLLLTPGTYATLRDEGAAYALRVTGAILGDGSRILVGLSTENRQFLTRIYRHSYPWALGGIILAGILVGIIASRRLLAPIVQLNEEIDRIIVTGELDYRLEGRGTGDELDGLVGRYNRLLDRVESLIGGMRDTLDAVAHDLRTPLTRLRGHAELALCKGDAGDSEEVLALIVEQTDQVGALLSALMDISEAEQGMMRLNPVACDLSHLAQQVCDLYTFVAEDKGQSLNLDAPDLVTVSGDPIRLQQVLGNLVDNAVKYGPEGGRTTIRCRTEGRYGVVDVEDTGPGVPPAERERIFERLYRGDQSRGSRGLGLGLSLVKALVEAHDGDISILNASGGGAVFRVRIPKERQRDLSES